MGTILSAYCESCGFVQHGLYYGIGFSQHEPKIPALRIRSHEIVVEEVSDDQNLRFYHHPEMYRGKFKKWEDEDSNPDIEDSIEEYGIQCCDIYLSPEKNLCPGCGKYTMEFVVIGNWD